VETLILHMKTQSKNSKILELLILRILEREREKERERERERERENMETRSFLLIVQIWHAVYTRLYNVSALCSEV